MGRAAAQRNLRGPNDIERLPATESRIPRERLDLSVRPRVLVLLATYNGEQWIEAQLQSILAQTGVDLHIIVRDDCSSDSTIAAVKRTSGSDRVTITVGATPSGSASQNFFALIRENSASDFDYIAFADQDDCWNVDKLSRACEQLKSSKAAGYSSSVVAFWKDRGERLLRQDGGQTRFDFLFEGAGQGCTFVLNGQFYERARAFVCAHGALTSHVQFHDWTMYALARCWDSGWIFDASPTVRYRQHDGNTIGAKYSLQGVQRRIALIRTGWYKTQLAAMAKLCVAAAPTRSDLRNWQKHLMASENLYRRLHLARICMLHGRRGGTDRMALLLAVLAGWI